MRWAALAECADDQYLQCYVSRNQCFDVWLIHKATLSALPVPEK
jgi:hypothetical protein